MGACLFQVVGCFLESLRCFFSFFGGGGRVRVLGFCCWFLFFFAGCTPNAVFIAQLTGRISRPLLPLVYVRNLPGFTLKPTKGETPSKLSKHSKDR